MKDYDRKITLALGGGGARGLSHLGILKVIEEHNIPINSIFGTSIGALVGAAYACNPDIKSIIKKVDDLFSDHSNLTPGLKRLLKIHVPNVPDLDLIHRISRIAAKHFFLAMALLKKSLISQEEMHEILEIFLPDCDISDTVIPFSAVSVDLITGKEVVLSNGPIIKAVMASCAVPGFLPPVEWDNMYLVDGGLIESIPTGAAKSHNNSPVIGVDVSRLLNNTPQLCDGIDIMNRAMEVMSYSLSIYSKKRADLIIDPSVHQVEWTDFLKYKELIQEGERAAKEKMPALLELINKKDKKKTSILVFLRSLLPHSSITPNT